MYSLPDYNGGSIVNLMSSISKSFGSRPKYKTLKTLSPKELDSRNIVLIVIDGLGYEFLKKNGKGTAFEKYLLGRITSVFPPTTAAAITTFQTGVAPQQHAVTGWFMNIKEMGIIGMPLPFRSRAGAFDLSKHIKIKDVINRKGFSDFLKAKTFVVTMKDIANSEYSILMAGKSKRMAYKTLNGFFSQISKAVKSGKRRKYIYAYWPQLDSICHHKGVESKKSRKHLRELNSGLKKFLKQIEGTDTTVIVTADHGLVDFKEIKMEKHPQMKKCLSLPLCGEPRAAFCYVHPSKTKQFKEYVKKKLRNKFELFKSEELVKKGWFGLFEPNEKLFDRIGDYILIAKNNYSIKDCVLGEKKHNFVAHHGGLSKEEMYVPLIAIKK